MGTYLSPWAILRENSKLKSAESFHRSFPCAQFLPLKQYSCMGQWIWSSQSMDNGLSTNLAEAGTVEKRLRRTKDRNTPFTALAPDRISPLLPTPSSHFRLGSRPFLIQAGNKNQGHLGNKWQRAKKNGQKIQRITSRMLAKERF